jgi:hypothetical protein
MNISRYDAILWSDTLAELAGKQDNPQAKEVLLLLAKMFLEGVQGDLDSARPANSNVPTRPRVYIVREPIE